MDGLDYYVLDGQYIPSIGKPFLILAANKIRSEIKSYEVYLVTTRLDTLCKKRLCGSVTHEYHGIYDENLIAHAAFWAGNKIEAIINERYSMSLTFEKPQFEASNTNIGNLLSLKIMHSNYRDLFNELTYTECRDLKNHIQELLGNDRLAVQKSRIRA